MKHLICASVLSCLVSVNAYALLSNSVTVGVRSSSNYLYPCNAGIAENTQSIARGVDYLHGAWVPSEHTPSAMAGEGNAVGGDTSGNIPDPDYAVLSTLLTDGTLLYRNYNQLLPEDTMYNYVIGSNPYATAAKLMINLASDTYNAAYFITFCFKPSKNGSDPGLAQELAFVSGRVTHSAVVGNTYNYAEQSGLKTMLDIKCSKVSGGVVQFYTPGGSTSIDVLLTPFAADTTVQLVPMGGIAINTADYRIYGGTFTEGTLPDECRARFHFIETSGTLRPHTLSSSDIQIDVDATVRAL
ncbi:MAG: hypothetical protein HYV97_19580 [Bdellovibrio sp.]|nr:hypothetical protein [Bdellovibrio sp.]